MLLTLQELHSMTDLLFYLFGFNGLAYVKLTTDFLTCLVESIPVKTLTITQIILLFVRQEFLNQKQL